MIARRAFIVDDKCDADELAQDVGPEAPRHHVQAAEITTREIDVAIRDLLARAFDRAREILQKRQRDLDAGAELMLKRETLTADDFPAIRSTGATSQPRLALIPRLSRIGVRIHGFHSAETSQY